MAVEGKMGSKVGAARGEEMLRSTEMQRYVCLPVYTVVVADWVRMANPEPEVESKLTLHIA